MKTSIHLVSAILIANLCGAPDISAAADIKVFSDGPVTPAIAAIADQFRRETGHRVDIVSEPGPALKRRMFAGEPADLLISVAGDIEELTKAGKIVAGGQAVIARIGIGLAVRERVPVPDVSTVDALKHAVLRADSLVYTTLPSGNHFAGVLERLGIAEQARPRTTRVASGAAIFEELLKRKGTDLGIGSMTQIVEKADQGIRLVGPLPADVQSFSTFAAGVMAHARSPAEAAAFVRFLSTSASKAAFAAAGAS